MVGKSVGSPGLSVNWWELLIFSLALYLKLISDIRIILKITIRIIDSKVLKF